MSRINKLRRHRQSTAEVYASLLIEDREHLLLQPEKETPHFLGATILHDSVKYVLTTLGFLLPVGLAIIDGLDSRNAVSTAFLIICGLIISISFGVYAARVRAQRSDRKS